MIADAHVAPDVDRLRDFLYPAFDELCAAAGVRKPQRPAEPVHPPRKRRGKTARRAAPAAAKPAAGPRSRGLLILKRGSSADAVCGEEWEEIALMIAP